METRLQALAWWRELIWDDKLALIQKHEDKFPYSLPMPPELVAMSTSCIEIIFKAEQ